MSFSLFFFFFFFFGAGVATGKHGDSRFRVLDLSPAPPQLAGDLRAETQVPR